MARDCRRRRRHQARRADGVGPAGLFRSVRAGIDLAALSDRPDRRRTGGTGCRGRHSQDAGAQGSGARPVRRQAAGCVPGDVGRERAVRDAAAGGVRRTRPHAYRDGLVRRRRVRRRAADARVRHPPRARCAVGRGARDGGAQRPGARRHRTRGRHRSGGRRGAAAGDGSPRDRSARPDHVRRGGGGAVRRRDGRVVRARAARDARRSDPRAAVWSKGSDTVSDPCCSDIGHSSRVLRCNRTGVPAPIPAPTRGTRSPAPTAACRAAPILRHRVSGRIRYPTPTPTAAGSAAA